MQQINLLINTKTEQKNIILLRYSERECKWIVQKNGTHLDKQTALFILIAICYVRSHKNGEQKAKRIRSGFVNE